jgi:PAS domain S-box-containing protein
MMDKAVILAVDDTPESLALLAGILTPAGYHVLPADSGELALAAAVANPPDMILLDVRMKGLDGLEVCRRLKAAAETKHIPIILISAFADVKEWVKGLQMGAADYISKPFQSEELLMRVSTHLALSRANVSLEKQKAALHQTGEELQSEIVERQRVEKELRQTLDQATRSRQALLSAIEDHKRAEDSLRETRDYLNSLIGYANAPIITWDTDKKITKFNHAFEKLTGYHADEVMGLELRVLFPPESLAESLQKIAHTSFGELWESVEIPIKRKNGEIRIALWNSANIHAKDGKTIVATIAQGQDISERKRAEEALHESEIKYRELFENAEVGMYRSKLDGSALLAVNAKLCEIFGYSKEEMLGNPATIRWADPRSRERMVTELRQVGFLHNYEMDILTKSTEIRNLLISVNLYPEHGYLEGSAIDITERKRTEEALRETSDYLNNLIGYANAPIITWDTDHRITKFNHAFEILTGNSTADMLGQNLNVLFPPESSAESLIKIANTSAGEFWDAVEIPIKRKNGEVRIALWNSANIHAKDGKTIVATIAQGQDITERKRAEKTLAESEKKLRALFETMSEGIVYEDHAGNIISANPAAERLLGLSLDQLQGRTSLDPRWKAIHEDGSPFPGESHSLNVAAKTGKSATGEVMGIYNPQAGAYVWLSVNSTPEFLPGEQQPFRAFAVFRDITERKRAEIDLQNLSSRNQAMLEAIPDIIMEVDTDKVYSWANHAGIDFFGADVIGREASYYFAGEQKTYLTVKPIFNGKEDVIYVESWQRRRDGEKRLLAWWCRVLKDESGNMTGALSSARDITEIQRAEEALRKSELKFRETIVNLDEGYYSVTLDGKLLEHNQAFNRILGFDIHKNLKGVQLPDFWQDPGQRQEYLKAFAATGSITNYQIDAKTRTGGKITILASAHLVKDENNRPQWIEGVFLDISERIRAELEIQRLNEELERRVLQRTAQLETANKELEAFSYSVSHDLRAPLRAIDGFARIVLEDYAKKLDDEGRRLLGVISSNTNKMGQLIDDLLAFSRLSRQQMAFAPVDLAALADDAFSELKSTEKGRRIEFKIGTHPAAFGDRSMLRHVLLNLLSNALKFTRPRAKARIEFGAQAAIGETICYVKDNGVGFNMEYAHKLFGVFQRLHGSDEFEGTGVGLAIVQRIVLRHGGRVWAESSKKGATFYFTIPNEKGRGFRV